MYTIITCVMLDGLSLHLESFRLKNDPQTTTRRCSRAQTETTLSMDKHAKVNSQYQVSTGATTSEFILRLRKAT